LNDQIAILNAGILVSAGVILLLVVTLIANFKTPVRGVDGRSVELVTPNKLPRCLWGGLCRNGISRRENKQSDQNKQIQKKLDTQYFLHFNFYPLDKCHRYME
jgi:hypothetical protein